MRRPFTESSQDMPFLAARDPRPLPTPNSTGLQPVGLFLGNGAAPLEVAVYGANSEPSRPTLRELHQTRAGNRPAPVVIVVQWGTGQAALATRLGEDVAVVERVDAAQAERVCEAALAQPDRNAAIRFLTYAVAQFDAPVPGLRNEGLFALHELRTGVRQRGDWADAVRRGRNVLSQRGRDIIQQLGFTVQPLPGPASVLLARGSKRAVAVFLDRPDEIDTASQHYDNVSPITYALAKADQENLEYVVVAAGAALRIYPVRPGIGTGRRGRTETYVELNLSLLSSSDAGYVWLLASADALTAGGSFESVLARSTEYAVDLGARLRDRVYQEVIPPLANALVRAQRLRSPTAERLAETYDMALLVLFRLLFISYAEDKDLLPLHSNAQYREHSLKRIAQRLLDDEQRGVEYGRGNFLWTEIRQLWHAVDRGNDSWDVPAYNGGLFAPSTDAGGTPAGERLERLTVADEEFAPALRALLVDVATDGSRGPVDFRSLGVREFGTIYEGLLESELSVALQDLALDRHGHYVPSSPGTPPVVEAGQVYLHNASGARKASGSYYTKSFAVEHLLDRALEPALSDHLSRLDSLRDADAGEQFFDFRVADLAMGSAHFLVAAIDRVERRLSNYLARRDLPRVRDELERLRAAAQDALGGDWMGDPIENAQLLRRQIARRCIFGVDLNPTAVELARLSIWIHTFVPGLPLSFLNQNLVVGNSLVGIATFEEARELLGIDGGDLFAFTADERLGRARQVVERLGRLADATASEVRQAKALFEELKSQVASEAGLLSVLAASRVDDELHAAVEGRQVATMFHGEGDFFSERLLRRADRVLKGVRPLHFPVAFPQVFLRTRPGFDVLLGNPPWEKTQVEEHEFWARHFPGFRGLSVAERDRRLPRMREDRPDLVEALEEERGRADVQRDLLVNGPYPGMGSGHPDLHKAFCWRFWHLAAREGGRIGVVLPRSVFASRGMAEFRGVALRDTTGLDLTLLINRGGWVFDNVHQQYEIALSVLARASRRQPGACVRMQGPFTSLADFEEGVQRPAIEFTIADVEAWTSTMAIPSLPTVETAAVFTLMRAQPRLDAAPADSWAFRPIQGDLNATNGRPFMRMGNGLRRGEWPVFGGESFDLWEPDRGSDYYYARAPHRAILAHLQERRLNAARLARSAFSELPADILRDPDTLACRGARIAFRDVTRATDTRTVRAALVPPEVVLVHNAPYMLRVRGDESDEAYLLGVLCSLPLDWYARRFVEKHLTFDIVNALPVPRPRPQSRLRDRVAAIAGRLAAADERYVSWARAVGVECGPLTDEQSYSLRCELDAAVAHLYGLSAEQLSIVFDTFHSGWDYSEQLTETLEHHRRLGRLT